MKHRIYGSNIDPALASIDPTTRKTSTHRKLAYTGALVVATVAALGAVNFISRTGGEASPNKARTIVGHKDGLIVGKIIVKSGNNVRFDPDTGQDLNAPINSSVGLSNVYKLVPEGQVFKSDYAEQVTVEDGLGHNSIWYVMPSSEGYVYAQVSQLDVNGINNVTVNGVNALAINPNPDLTLSNKNGISQVIDAQSNYQNIPLATLVSASSV
jgi:hypothetical protein